MSESVVKIRIDSQEYDAKLKRAGEALNRYFNTVKSGNGTLKHLDEGVLDATRALGKMETVSQTAKGKVRELTSAYTDLAVQYRQLSAEERSSVFGKALATSLDQLKGRISETKRQLAEVSEELSGGGNKGGKLDGMLAVFGGTMLTKITTSLATFASTGVDALKQVVSESVELARQGEGIRIAFDRLNRPDLLDKLREATHGTVTDLELMKQAVKFNDFNLSLDEMGTMLAFAQQKAKDTGQSVDYMVDSIVTGLGRQSLMILDNLGLSASEVKNKMKETGDMTKAVGAIIREQMAAAGGHIETAADRAKKADVDMKNAMEELGRTFMPLKEAGESLFNSMAIAAINALNKMRPFFDKFTEAGRIRQAKEGYGGADKVSQMISMLGDGKSARSRNTYAKQLEEFERMEQKLTFSIKANERDKDVLAKSRIRTLKEELTAVRELRAEYTKQADEVFNPTVKKKTTTTTEPEKKQKKELTEMQVNQQKINDLTQEYVRLGDESTESSRQRQVEIQREIELLRERNGLLGLRAEQAEGRLTLGAGDFQRDALNANPGTLMSNPDKFGRDGNGTLKLQLDENSMKSVTKNIEKSLNKQESTGMKTVANLGNVVGGVSGILSGLNQLGIEIPKGLSQVLGAMQIMSGILSTISALVTYLTARKSIPLLANGGMVHAAGGLVVPGNFMSNDKVPALLNSGEIVLNRAQQGVLASAIQGGGNEGSVSAIPYVTGETIWLGLNNFLTSRGMGEIMTTNTNR